MLYLSALQKHQWLGAFGTNTKYIFLKRLPLWLLCAGMGAAVPAQALEFSPLKGGYGSEGEVRLQSQVRQLPVGSESQLRSTCLRATIQNSSPASQYSTDTEPVPMLVDFDVRSRSTGVVHLKSLRTVADPVAIVNLRSDCPLAVFEVSWTVFLTPPVQQPESKEPRWEVNPVSNLVASNDTELRDFNLNSSSLLNQSRKPAANIPVPGMPSAEARSQMLRLKSELQKENTASVAVPEKTAPQKPDLDNKPVSAPTSLSVVAPKAATATTVAAPMPTTPAAPAIEPSGMSSKDMPVPGALASASPSGTGQFSEQTGIIPAEDPSALPPVQEVALASSASQEAAVTIKPADDLDRLNKMVAGDAVADEQGLLGLNWYLMAFSGLALLLMSFGAFWCYRRFGVKSSSAPAGFFRQGGAVDKSEMEPALFAPKASAAKAKNQKQESDEEDEKAWVLPTQLPAFETEKGAVVADKLEEKDEPVPDAARLFESMLGADGPAVSLASGSSEHDEVVPVFEGRQREGLESTLQSLERASIKPWKLPVAYASLVSARNRSLAAGLSSQVLRCEVGLLELAFQETRRGRMLDQSAVNELLSTLVPGGVPNNSDVPAATVVADIVKSHLKTKRYELSGLDAQNRFKANCLQLKTLCQVWPFCFVLPEWAELVDETHV